VVSSTRILSATAAYNGGAIRYQEAAYPSALAHQLFKLIRKEGVAKISYSLVAMGLPPPVLKYMQGYFEFAQQFRTPGFDF